MDETTNTIDLIEQQEQAEATQLEVVSTINNLYAEAEALSKSAKEYAEKAVGIALECGKLLVEQKKQVGHGNWETWCNENLSFTERTARKYMGLTRKMITKDEEGSNRNYGSVLAEQPKTLRQAYIATGILPEAPKPNKEDNFSECFNQKNVRYVKHIDKAVASLRTIFEDDPLSQWTLQRQKALMLNLKPLVAIHEELENLEITLP